MTANNSKFAKIYSQSAILTAGTILASVSLFLFKIIFYKKSSPDFYSEFLIAYSIYLFYQILGFMNVGNPLSNDLNKVKDREGIFSKYTLNAVIVTIVFSLIADIFLVINLILIKTNYLIILFFCLAMIIDNMINILIAIYRGIENIVLSSIILIIKGIFKPVILFSFSFFLELTSENIALIFFISEAISLLISSIIVIITLLKNKEKKGEIIISKKIIRTYILQGILLVIISLCIQGFWSALFILVKIFVSEEILGFVDVPITFTLFILTFFINIGLILTTRSDVFKDKNEFLKKIVFRIFITCLFFVFIYDIVSYFVTVDDFLLETIFNLDGSILAMGVMILIHSFPFYVVFYLCSGYKQGHRQYYGITISAISSFIISLIPSIFLVKYFNINGALYSIIIFSIIIAVISLLITYFDTFDSRIGNFIKKIRQKISKERLSEQDLKSNKEEKHEDIINRSL